jgi:hypothetical protein
MFPGLLAADALHIHSKFHFNKASSSDLHLSDAVMNATDVLVLEYLAAYGGFADHQVAHLCAWWQAAAHDAESLTSFLLRQALFTGPTVQIFRQVAEGHLSRTMGFALLDRDELKRMRRRLPDIARFDDAKATVTLLAADDTAKDSPASADDPPPHVGGMLGKYLLTEWVGQGATGSVFRALHPSLHIPVAIKVLNPDGGTDERERLNRLKAEARLLARLNHPNVVRVYDFEAHPRYPFLVLEHVNGPTLAELIEQSGRIQADRVIRIVRQLAEGLAAAHELGVVHRDIKPANVLLTRGGDVKLADLGLAAVRTPLSSAGAVRIDACVGTACYLAPELVVTRRTADERTDMYSLGATFYHALTGRPPFEASEPWRVIEQHARAPRPCPRDRAPEVPADVAELVVRMLACDPAQRPNSFSALLREPALNRVHSPVPIPVDETKPEALWQRLLRPFAKPKPPAASACR